MYFGIRAYIIAIKAMRSADFFKSGFVKSIFSGSVGEELRGAINEVNITFRKGRVELTLGREHTKKKSD